MDLAGLRAELARIDARLEELDRAPRPARDVAREATDLALQQLRSGGAGVVKRHSLQFSKVEKLLSGGKRMIRGIASSAAMDRVGDIVMPQGGKWRLPVIMLAQHDHNRPVGWVRSIVVRGSELHVEAEIAQGIGDADAVWQLVEAQLLNDFSIGFRALPGGVERMENGGLRYTAWELLELSIVTVGAHQDARIARTQAGAKANRRSSLRTDGAVRLVHAHTGRPPVKLLTPTQMAKHQRETCGIPLKYPRRADGAVELIQPAPAKHDGAVRLIKPVR